MEPDHWLCQRQWAILIVPYMVMFFVLEHLFMSKLVPSLERRGAIEWSKFSKSSRVIFGLACVIIYFSIPFDAYHSLICPPRRHCEICGMHERWKHPHVQPNN